MLELLTELGTSKHGATVIEYGPIAALISVVAFAALTTIGDSLTTVFGVSQIGHKGCHEHSPGVQIRGSIR